MGGARANRASHSEPYDMSILCDVITNDIDISKNFLTIVDCQLACGTTIEIVGQKLSNMSQIQALELRNRLQMKGIDTAACDNE